MIGTLVRFVSVVTCLMVHPNTHIWLLVHVQVCPTGAKHSQAESTSFQCNQIKR